jgi:hypothetical protein
MTKASICVPGVLTVLLSLVCCGALASEESGHHQFPHHHVAVFAGAGLERDGNHEENGLALGLEYEVQWNERWGVGVDVEKLFGDGQHRSSVVAIPVSFHATENWRLFAGPGLEFGSEKEKDKYLFRFGVAYEIAINERWSASPEILVDFIEGGAKTYVLGFAVGYGF